MPSPVQVRAASERDLDTIGRMGAALVAAHHGLDPRRFLAPTPATPRGYVAFLGSQLRTREAVVLVAEKDGEIVGYAYAASEGTDYMALRGPAGVLHDLFVGPDHRREGIGKALLDAAVAALSERGAPRIVLSTAKRNEAAQRLFAEAGFQPTMVEMTLELDQA